MIAYLRDAHEQKRSTVLSCWRNSKRWQRVHAWDPVKKEDTNDDNSGPTVKDNGDEKLDLSRSSQVSKHQKGSVSQFPSADSLELGGCAKCWMWSDACETEVGGWSTSSGVPNEERIPAASKE